MKTTESLVRAAQEAASRALTAAGITRADTMFVFMTTEHAPRYGEILGATIVGPEATEIIHELVLARTAELTVDEIIATVHAHPTLSEGIHEAGLGVAGLPIHI